MRSGRPATKINACMEWLFGYLKDGAVRISQVRNASDEAGFSARLLYRAKDNLKITESGKTGSKQWGLSEESVLPEREPETVRPVKKSTKSKLRKAFRLANRIRIDSTNLQTILAELNQIIEG